MNNKQTITEKIVQFILNQKGSNLAKLSLESLSQELDIQKDELASMKLDDDETSINHFLNRQKVFMAMETIEREPELTAEEIAERCGFSDYETFNQQFADYFLIDSQRCLNLKKFGPLIQKLKDEFHLMYL